MKSLPDKPRIADVATGSGIFLAEISKQLDPSSQLDGFDITSRAFPSDLPSNVSLQVHDARTPFPEELQGKYDLVHLRLLFAVVSSSDWESIATNAIQLLKPNGAIQWTEPKSGSASVLRGEQVIDPVTLRTMQQRINNTLNERSQHGYRILPDLYKRHGLSRISQDVLSTDRIPDTREAFTRITLRGLLAWARQIAKTEKPGFWTMQELEGMETRCEEEIDAGAYIRFEIEVTIGFKANVADDR